MCIMVQYSINDIDEYVRFGFRGDKRRHLLAFLLWVAHNKADTVFQDCGLDRWGMHNHSNAILQYFNNFFIQS